MMKKKSGFTLAEVLTTLMVIGVVAAMTIPTLMNSTDDQQNKVAYKKAMSVLSQGIQMLTAQENECYDELNGNDNKAIGLATCMATIMSGSLNRDEITTLDGMVYRFYVNTSKTDASTLEELCGQVPANTEEGWKGGGSCGVMVDTNGHSKGTKAFPGSEVKGGEGEDKDQLKDGNINFTANGFSSQPTPKDLLTFSLSANGVRPTYFSNAANKGYEYMYGKTTEDPFRNVKQCYLVENGEEKESKQVDDGRSCSSLGEGWTETKPE